MERVGIAIQKHFLQQELIPESSLYLGQPACNASVSNDSHVLLAVGWGECGTLVQSVRNRGTSLRVVMSCGGPGQDLLTKPAPSQGHWVP